MCKETTRFFIKESKVFLCSKEECQQKYFDKSLSSKLNNKRFISYNMKEITIRNTKFREIIYSSEHMQIVLMSLKPKEFIEKEIHEYITQIITVKSGSATIQLFDNELNNNPNTTIELNGEKGNDTFIILPDTYHKVINSSSEYNLKIYTIYSSNVH